jgi:sulfite exporter TauE/SafE/copper chaperone CopZ
MQSKVTYKFYIQGMHCKSCALFIQQELSDLSYVNRVIVDVSASTVEVTGDFEGIPQEELAKDFSVMFLDRGYSFFIDKKEDNKNWSDFKIAVPVALVFVVIFLLLQKTGLVSVVNSSNVTFGTAFVLGLVASISSCAAVVGGLVLSMSATFAKEGDKIKPQLFFHSGRMISFFIFGGVIGVIGSAFTLSSTMSFILSFIIGLVMLLLGINLLGIFDFTKKLQPSMPKFISKHALGVSRWNHRLTPFLVGAVTFFLPCGFTQSMQVYTLSTGAFLQGGLTMFVFALGTLPALALISFSSLGFINNSKSGIFFRSAGIIVIFFAVFNLLNSLVVIGLLPPIFHF